MGQSVTIHYDTRSPDENALTEYADSGSDAWFAPLKPQQLTIAALRKTFYPWE